MCFIMSLIIKNKHFKNKDFIQMKEILEKIKKELDDEKK